MFEGEGNRHCCVCTNAMLQAHPHPQKSKLTATEHHQRTACHDPLTQPANSCCQKLLLATSLLAILSEVPIKHILFSKTSWHHLVHPQKNPHNSSQTRMEKCSLCSAFSERPKRTALPEICESGRDKTVHWVLPQRPDKTRGISYQADMLQADTIVTPYGLCFQLRGLTVQPDLNPICLTYCLSLSA